MHLFTPKDLALRISRKTLIKRLTGHINGMTFLLCQVCNFRAVCPVEDKQCFFSQVELQWII